MGVVRFFGKQVAAPRRALQQVRIPERVGAVAYQVAQPTQAQVVELEPGPVSDQP